jgi:hypothetical protein
MTAPTLWIEITIAGFVYLVALCFFFLAIFKVSGFQILQPAKDFLPYISAGAIAASYVTGIVAHRIVQMISLGFFDK